MADLQIIKVGMFTVEGPAQGGLLVDVKVQTFGDSTFFVGQLGDDDSGDPRIGLTYWFPAKDVRMIIQFADMKEALNYYAEWKKRSPKSTNQ